jgi:hypothetical protein
MEPGGRRATSSCRQPGAPRQCAKNLKHLNGSRPSGRLFVFLHPVPRGKGASPRVLGDWGGKGLPPVTARSG